MLKNLALILGGILVILGIGGFVPVMTTDSGLIFGIFQIDTVHNLIHLTAGLFAIAAAVEEKYSVLFFQVFGVVLLAITVIGFAQGDTVLGIAKTNGASNVLHLVVTGIALYVGFGPLGDDVQYGNSKAKKSKK